MTTEERGKGSTQVVTVTRKSFRMLGKMSRRRKKGIGGGKEGCETTNQVRMVAQLVEKFK